MAHAASTSFVDNHPSPKLGPISTLVHHENVIPSTLADSPRIDRAGRLLEELSTGNGMESIMRVYPQGRCMVESAVRLFLPAEHGENQGRRYGTVIFSNKFLVTSLYNFVARDQLNLLMAGMSREHTQRVVCAAVHRITCQPFEISNNQGRGDMRCEPCFVDARLGILLLRILDTDCPLTVYYPISTRTFAMHTNYEIDQLLMMSASPHLNRGCLYPQLNSVAATGMIVCDQKYVPIIAILQSIFTTFDGHLVGDLLQIKMFGPSMGNLKHVGITEILRPNCCSIQEVILAMSLAENRRYVVGLDGLIPSGLPDEREFTYKKLLVGEYGKHKNNAPNRESLKDCEFALPLSTVIAVRNDIHNRQMSATSLANLRAIGANTCVILTTPVANGTVPLAMISTLREYHALLSNLGTLSILSNDYRLQASSCYKTPPTLARLKELARQHPFISLPRVEEAVVTMVGVEHGTPYVTEILNAGAAGFNADRLTIYWINDIIPPRLRDEKTDRGIRIIWCPAVAHLALNVLALPLPSPSDPDEMDDVLPIIVQQPTPAPPTSIWVAMATKSLPAATAAASTVRAVMTPPLVPPVLGNRDSKSIKTVERAKWRESVEERPRRQRQDISILDDVMLMGISPLESSPPPRAVSPAQSGYLSPAQDVSPQIEPLSPAQDVSPPPGFEKLIEETYTATGPTGPYTVTSNPDGVANMPPAQTISEVADSTAPSPPINHDNDCIHCMERVKSTIFTPCGHLHHCWDCAKMIKEQLKSCPLCSVPIADIFRVYT